MRKKILAVLLAMAMSLSMAACGGGDTVSTNSNETEQTEENKEESKTETGEEAKEEDSAEDEKEASGLPPADAPIGGEVVVGVGSDVTNDFMTGWTNGEANNRIKALINAYSNIVFTREGKFEVDPTVVKEYDAKENEDGSKTYTFTLNENLTWNDGTPITAKDYVFSALLISSSQFESLQADTALLASIDGYKEFNGGEKKEFSGVRLLGDYQFSMTIAADELPNYYELTLVTVQPYPMSVIAPDCEVKDDGNGVYIEGNFTNELLGETIGNSSTGYRFLPKVTCGPYNFGSYDPATKICTLTRNDKYVGDYRGATPHIEKIIVKTVTKATQMDELKAGTVDLIRGVSGGEEINKGLDMVDAGVPLDAISYDGSSYSKFLFVCDLGPTQFREVRQAIAYCFDRDEYTKQMSQGYGTVVDGCYSRSLWEYQDNKDALAETLTHYSLDTEKAKQLLIDGGWTLNEKGEAFVEGTDKIRHKEVDGELMPLTIKWACTESDGTNLLLTMLPPEMEKIGMNLEPTKMDWAVVLNNMFRENIEEPTYNMFNVSTGFATVNTAWYFFSDEDKYMGSYNGNYIRDKAMVEVTQAMKNVAPGDDEDWSAKWLAYQQEFNKALPALPISCSENFDFYNTKIKNFDADSQWAWDSALVSAYIEE